LWLNDKAVAAWQLCSDSSCGGEVLVRPVLAQAVVKPQSTVKSAALRRSAASRLKGSRHGGCCRSSVHRCL